MTGTIPPATRRQFLKHCAAVGGALGFTSLIAACATPPPSASAPAAAPPTTAAAPATVAPAATAKPAAPSAPPTPASATQAAVKGGTLTFGSSADVVSLDPAN